MGKRFITFILSIAFTLTLAGPLTVMAAEDDMGIEPLAAAGTKLYAFSIVSIEGVGKYNLSDTAVQSKTYNYSLKTQENNKTTSHSPNFYFDRNEPIIITYYRYGSGNIDGFKSYGKPYTIVNGRNYNYTFGSDGGAVAWYTEMKLMYAKPTVSEINLYLTGTSKDVYNRVEFERYVNLKFFN